jgi:uncharacterized protein (TIRG00374 family)
MRGHFRTVVALSLTAGLLVLFFRNASVTDVWLSIRQARLEQILGALVVTGATYAIRALRWQQLLAPVGETRFGTAFRSTVIGFAASFLLPARAGELLRPYLLARWERLSATATFATIILERLLDLVTVLILFASFMLVFDPGMAAVDPRVFEAIKVGGLLAGAGALAALVMVFALAGHPETLGRAALGIERVLPARVAHATARLVQLFAEGLAVMRRPSRLLAALALSFPLWLSIAAGIWLVARAFSITMPFTGSFLLIALLVVGVALPTPGAVGGFHEMFRLGATTFYAVPNDTAVGAAIVLHAISFLPVTVLGVVFMAQAGLSLHRMRALARAGDQAVEAGDPGARPWAAGGETGLPDVGARTARHEGSL